MKVVPSREQLLRAAHVFGLGGDVEGNVDRTDNIDKLLLQLDYAMAFVTHTDHISGTDERLGALGVSEIAIHNASTPPKMFIDWEKRLSIIKKKDGTLLQQMQMRRDIEFCKYYLLHDATFAATEVNGIPERIFLYVESRGFDMEKVIELLRVHRLLNPLPGARDLRFIYSYWS